MRVCPKGSIVSRLFGFRTGDTKPDKEQSLEYLPVQPYPFCFSPPDRSKNQVGNEGKTLQ